jgi:hypothetical protein
LVAQLAAIHSTDDAAAWAHRNLAAKNSLTAAEVQIVEERFQARLSTIGDGLGPMEPSNAVPVQSVMPTGRTDATPGQTVSTESGKTADEGAVRALVESAQIRAACALLDGRQKDLSKASGVGTATIQCIEKSPSLITGYISTLVRIQAAFEQARIQFIENDEMGGFGLQMAKRTRRR